jgi:hypothetical protein
MIFKRTAALLLVLAITMSFIPLNLTATAQALTTADAQTALKAATGLITLTPEQIAKYDMDGDGKITTMDALLILHVVVGVTGFQPANAGITPLMWHVTSPQGATMYLFGSIHVGDDSIYPFPDTIMNAFYSSDYLAVEIDVTIPAPNPPTQAEINASMTYPRDDNIRRNIDRDVLEAARKVIVQWGIIFEVPIQYLDWFKPFVWISLLSEIALNLSGLSHEKGVDLFFIKEANRIGMPVLEVEYERRGNVGPVFEFSNDIYTTMMIEATDVENSARETRELYELWKRGNYQILLERIKPTYEAEKERYGDDEDFWEFYEAMMAYDDAMLVQRDILMAQRAKQYMAEGKKVFFVVGLAHFLGQGSVIDLLRKDGYTIVQMTVR